MDEEEGERGEEEEGRGVVPLSESRYPHLAGGEIENTFRKTINTLVVGRNFGILMAFLQQKEKCWNMLNPKGPIASICSSIFWKSMSNTFFCLWKDWAATIFMFLWRHRMQKLLLFVFVQWQKFTQL